MKTDLSRNRNSNEWVRALPDFLTTLRSAGLDNLDALSAQTLGEVVTEHRSSWVRSTAIGPTNVYVKTYDYSTPADRRRGWFRTTWLARSRAAREWDALRWLDLNGFPAVEPLLLGESRCFGVLRRAVLVTRAWDGSSAEAEFIRLAGAERDALVGAIRAVVTRWHHAGFRDGNLDLRNILVHREPDDEWVVTKIDSPRFRLRRAGERTDRLTRADWRRLDADLARVESEVGERG